MLVTLLKSKLHRATVTDASLHYEGSLTIAEDLAQRVGLARYERILVSNMANGARFETYVIYGAAGSGAIELNGAAAHLGKKGDRLTIMSFGMYNEEEARTHQPKVALLNEENHIVRMNQAQGHATAGC
jgi:aspartate 1-decarboxylase